MISSTKAYQQIRFISLLEALCRKSENLGYKSMLILVCNHAVCLTYTYFTYHTCLNFYIRVRCVTVGLWCAKAPLLSTTRIMVCEKPSVIYQELIFFLWIVWIFSSFVLVVIWEGNEDKLYVYSMCFLCNFDLWVLSTNGLMALKSTFLWMNPV